MESPINTLKNKSLYKDRETLDSGLSAVNQLEGLRKRLEKTYKDLEKEVDLGEIVEQTLKMKEVEYQNNNGLAFQISGDFKDTIVLGNESKLAGVFNNLINNSVNAIGKDSKGMIELNFRNKESGPLTVKIIDNGRGIKKLDLEKVLVKGISIGPVKGKGLGLSSAKQTIERMGGDFTIDSVEGSGTTVTMKIPLNV